MNARRHNWAGWRRNVTVDDTLPGEAVNVWSSIYHVIRGRRIVVRRLLVTRTGMIMMILTSQMTDIGQSHNQNGGKNLSRKKEMDRYEVCMFLRFCIKHLSLAVVSHRLASHRIACVKNFINRSLTLCNSNFLSDSIEEKFSKSLENEICAVLRVLCTFAHSDI